MCLDTLAHWQSTHSLSQVGTSFASPGHTYQPPRVFHRRQTVKHVPPKNQRDQWPEGVITVAMLRHSMAVMAARDGQPAWAAARSEADGAWTHTAEPDSRMNSSSSTRKGEEVPPSAGELAAGWASCVYSGAGIASGDLDRASATLLSIPGICRGDTANSAM